MPLPSHDQVSAVLVEDATDQLDGFRARMAAPAVNREVLTPLDPTCSIATKPACSSNPT